MAILLIEERTLHELGGSNCVVIPASMLQYLGWKLGDKLIVQLEEKSKGRFISVFKRQ